MSGSLKFPMSSADSVSETIEMKVKEEMRSNEDELGMEFIPDIHPTQTTSIYHLVPDSEIKHEEMDFHHNSTTNADSADHFDQDHGIMSNTPYLDCSAIRTEEKELMKDSYLDLLQCQRDCETCQRYLNLLIEHVRSTHCPTQPTRESLHIDILNVDPGPSKAQQSTSSVQIKCEVDENIDKVKCSQEEDLRLNSESDPEFESQSESCESDTDTDPDYDVAPHFTRNVRRPSSTKKNASSDSKSSKAKKGVRSSAEQFRCNTCDIKVSTKRNLATHKRIHTGERPYIDECWNRFTQQSTLSSHRKVHRGERPHKCDQCERSFSRSSDLTTHRRIHTGERPYKCDQCERSFSRSSDLTTHKRIHTGERLQFKCNE